MGRARRRPARPARVPARPAVPARHQGRSPAHSDLHSYARVVNNPPDSPPENGGKASAVHSPNTARMRIICDPAAARTQCVRDRCASGPHPYTTPVPQPFECHSSERGQERPCSHPISDLPPLLPPGVWPISLPYAALWTSLPQGKLPCGAAERVSGTRGGASGFPTGCPAVPGGRSTTTE